MQRLLILLGAFILFSTSAFAANVNGVWRTQATKDGYILVKISACGSKYCGTIIKAINEKGKNNTKYKFLGKRMIWAMEDKGNGTLKNGKIFAPDSEQTFSSTMQLKGNKLTVKGCALGGLICRGQTWTRVRG